MIVSKSQALFRPELRKAPAHPLGERVFVRPLPIATTTESGLEIADIAKKRQFSGRLIAVGDQAADKLWDLGVRLGDEIWYAQYAGIIEEWQHLLSEGEGACPHDSAWDFIPREDKRWSLVAHPDSEMQLRSCRSCGAVKVSERVIMMSCEDIVCDVDLQVRLDRGEMKRIRKYDTEGKTRYVIHQPEDSDTFETYERKK